MGHWTLFSNHGHVLLFLAGDPEARLRDVAEQVGITERAVQKIVRDLQDEGLVSVTKRGRRNRYRIHTRKALRHPLEAHRTVGHLVKLICDGRPVAQRAEDAPPARAAGVKRPADAAGAPPWVAAEPEPSAPPAEPGPQAPPEAGPGQEAAAEPQPESRSESAPEPAPRPAPGSKPEAEPESKPAARRKARKKKGSTPDEQQGSLF